MLFPADEDGTIVLPSDVEITLPSTEEADPVVCSLPGSSELVEMSEALLPKIVVSDPLVIPLVASSAWL